MGIENSALEVADRVIRLSIDEEIPVTPLQVQKLTYFCHAWMLGLGRGPLFYDAVEAWQYGPVIRAVYHALKEFGGEQVTRSPLLKPATFADDEEELIRAVWRRYGQLDGIVLSRMSHAEGSPWEQTYRRDPSSQIIHQHLIRDYFADLIAKRKQSE